MELILNETISTLGRIGDVVTVKDGYGRNYLLPQKKAIPATRENLEQLEQNRAEIAAKLAEETKAAEAIGKKIAGAVITIEELASDDERLFGSVTSGDVAARLAELDVNIDKRQVVLTDPIKTLGEYDITIKLGFDITAEIKLVVAGKKN
ncbi:MAG: 50S ribosomal protein L9 [Deltaproteobacteria bacterium]|nr:MAG: 50S ribosomal protein L9 [Deltaproteobacteria bacterium]